MTDTTAREALVEVLHSEIRVPVVGASGQVIAHDTLILAEGYAQLLADALLASPALDAVVAERVAALAEDEEFIERVNRVPHQAPVRGAGVTWTRPTRLFAGRAPSEIADVLRALAAALRERGQSTQPTTTPTECPHAAPFRYCNGCAVHPCPLGLDTERGQS